MVIVEPTSITNIKAPHELTQISTYGFYHKVEMIGHQNISIEHDSVYVERFSQHFEKMISIIVIKKYISPLISAARNMIECPRILNS
jgi:hypothetical protein